MNPQGGGQLPGLLVSVDTEISVPGLLIPAGV